MEATMIDQLFTEVLEEIFSHLSASDLKNCALVCKDWNEMIGSSAVSMKKLKIGFRLGRDNIFYGLDLEGNRGGILMQGSDETCRKYQHVKILSHDGSLMQLQRLDRFNISQVKTLDLRLILNGSLELGKVMKFLSRMPLLQVLNIYLGAICTIDTSNTLAVHFEKLRQLKVQIGFVDQQITQIFEFIKANNITELTYHAAAPHSDEAADFIKSNKSLAKLTVSADLFVQLLRRHVFSGMNLESLNVEFFRGFDRSNVVIENFRKSLISNAHSLTSLSIPSRLLSKEVLLVIFNRLRMLTRLYIDGVYDGDGPWMENLSTNDISHELSLKTLKITRVGAIIGLKAILQRSPQLKKLTLGGITDEIMKEVAASGRGLIELKIDSLKENITCDQRFIELKSLIIDILDIEHVTYLPSLLEMCPKIEVFECRYYRSEDPSSLIDILLHPKTLKHLRFHCYTPEARRIIFDKLKINYGNLRLLEFRSARGEFVFFDFSENPAEWDDDEQEARFADYQAANHRAW